MKKFLLAGAALLAVPASANPGNNQSSVDQSGAGAVATVIQSGQNSKSAVTQTGGGTVQVNQSGSRGSTSTVNTSADDRPPESIVKVTQTDNGAGGTDDGKANISTVVQDNVNGFGASGTGSTVTVVQEKNEAGGSNTSYVQQGRNAVSGQVTVTQSGAENNAYYSSTTSTDNDAIIGQYGKGNNTTVFQNFQNGSALANVLQVNAAGGADNNAYIEQASAGFSTDPAQFAVGADAIINQIGAGNSSSIVQTGYSQSEGTSNLAVNTQSGDNHSSSILQSGVDNSTFVIQSGVGNASSVLQSGNANIATVTQGSNNNVSNIVQSGNGNTATVTQGM